ncbi:hypothetical protein COLO4_27917 [Corchorus olitorius]|uniref:t-SNARE coiled-coil homology domain-containing protein n=1 Tax=Corchorus olitorius TaxID=93759 RepID=A0A1R3HNL8_9ROSI|nr:hypothetical protein COLO4_27917 [Corchorus olitorius]
MFGFMRPKPPQKADSDTEETATNTITPERRTSSEPVLLTPENNEEDNHGRRKQTSASTRPSPARGRDRYKNDFKDSGGLQNQTMEELENYAVYKAEETTSAVNNCLRIAEDIRQDATKTLDTLHKQGEQIERTHNMAVEIDKDLSKGEKLLNSLGDKTSKKDDKNKEQREKLGLSPAPKGAGSKTPQSEPTNAIQKVELEKAKQDDALDDLSGILGDLKGMACEMGSELDRQNKALDHLDKDIDELNNRVKGANQRARHLLAK